jgi:hypothetical protein
MVIRSPTVDLVEPGAPRLSIIVAGPSPALIIPAFATTAYAINTPVISDLKESTIKGLLLLKTRISSGFVMPSSLILYETCTATISHGLAAHRRLEFQHLVEREIGHEQQGLNLPEQPGQQRELVELAESLRTTSASIR